MACTHLCTHAVLNSMQKVQLKAHFPQMKANQTETEREAEIKRVRIGEKEGATIYNALFYSAMA